MYSYNGRLTAPKNSSNFEEMMYALGIYYDDGNYISSKEFQGKMQLKYSSKNRSQCQNITQPLRELNFVELLKPMNSSSDARITSIGRELYEAYKDNDSDAIRTIWLRAISEACTGAANSGNPESSSPIERLAVFINAVNDLGSLTNLEYAFIIQGMCNCYNMNRSIDESRMKDSYARLIQQVRRRRESGHEIIADDIYEDFKKFIDDKDVDFLLKVGIFEKQQNEGDDSDTDAEDTTEDLEETEGEE